MERNCLATPYLSLDSFQGPPKTKEKPFNISESGVIQTNKAWEFDEKGVDRRIDSNRKVWFCGKDVCEILGFVDSSRPYGNTSMMAKRSPYQRCCHFNTHQ